MKRRPLAPILAAACVVAVMAGSASAQNKPSAAASKFAPVPTPVLDPDMLKIPDSPQRAGAGRFKLDKPDAAAPAPSLPNKVDLGKYDLEFKAGDTRDIDPRTGLDSGEKSNLSNSSLSRRSGSALPDYFGLKLSAPTK